MFKDRELYRRALPMIYSSLFEAESGYSKARIASAIRTKNAQTREMWPMLAKEYQDLPDIFKDIAHSINIPDRFDPKRSIANALFFTFHKKWKSEMIALIEDQKNGSTRDMLVYPLRKMVDEEVVQLFSKIKNEKTFAKFDWVTNPADL